MENVCMTFELLGVHWYVQSMIVAPNGSVEMTLINPTSQAIDTVTAEGLEALAGPLVPVTLRSGRSLAFRRVMRRPWRYEQMTRAKVSDNALGTVIRFAPKA